MSVAQSPALLEMLTAARRAARVLATAKTTVKDAALDAIARRIEANAGAIAAENARDLAAGAARQIGAGLLDRLALTPPRLEGLARAVREIIGLVDPVGEVVRGHDMPNGVRLTQVRVPFGVIGAIYEARPNVTIDIAALALKSGNAVVLRGGSAAEHSNRILVQVLQEAIESVGLPPAIVQTIDPFGREGARALMAARGYVDVLVPRGSADLIETVVRESNVPVIETGAGVVHIFLDESANHKWAVEIVHNAKVQRCSVCNAVETLLVHEACAADLLPEVLGALRASGVTIHADERARAIFPDSVPATPADFGHEYMSMDLAVKVVSSLDEALEHIAVHSTRHTESIVTNDLRHAERFLAEVDSAVVMVNASTRFTDGGQFGFGAEVGISTQKLHARGPMGLPELTSTKWIVRGLGQVRE